MGSIASIRMLLRLVAMPVEFSRLGYSLLAHEVFFCSPSPLSVHLSETAASCSPHLLCFLPVPAQTTVQY